MGSLCIRWRELLALPDQGQTVGLKLDAKLLDDQWPSAARHHGDHYAGGHQRRRDQARLIDNTASRVLVHLDARDCTQVAPD